jgi:hypothetical protein
MTSPWVGLAAVLAAGCATGAASGPLVPETPVLASRCRVGASQTSILVTEWSATEKANIQAALSGGAIAVQFSGCELRLIPNCRLPGAYNWQRTTPTSERVEIKNDAELYAKLPLGAANLNAELKKSGELAVQTTVSGQARLAGFQATMVPSDPSCADATHLVDALSVGAFTLSAGGSQSTAGGIEVKVVGESRGSLSQSAKVLRSAGVVEACAQATDDSPAWDCASPLQVFLAPIPGKAEPEGPPGTVRVDFVSLHDNVRWDVIINDDATCTTPCAGWIDPSRPVALRSREEAPQKLAVSRLVTGAGPLQVSARPKQLGKFSGGVVATAFGGIGIATGVTLLAVGTGTDRDGMALAGTITLPIGAALTVGGIYLMVKARAAIRVRPLFGSDGPIMTITPGGIVGSF